MTRAVVPYQPSFPSLIHADQHESAVSTRRQEVIDGLKYVAPLCQAAESLDDETLYKLVLKPEGGKLHKDAAGNIKGVFYRKGKILKHARFKQVRRSLVRAIRGAGTQVLIINFALQLDGIRRGVQDLAIDLHNDRLAEIDSGRNQLAQALRVEDGARRERLIEHAIQTLNEGIAKTLRELRKGIAKLPTAEVKLHHDWGRNRTEQAKQKIALASESYQACLLGIQLLSTAVPL